MLGGLAVIMWRKCDTVRRGIFGVFARFILAGTRLKSGVTFADIFKKSIKFALLE